ncbi:RNA polymerase sigma factor [Flagellimonas flava]|uniref:RNA polymerase sigma-70 factor, ECF subfamily n=1 Tax=Flagellimonas flava TaxID=570519 RepID=A0A1M5P055_9FLAO|nr:sigma-70 family RNA polymerase sigma factor [Allomuricauda flava]SHG95151.1 RNA polymerase sigma-70 factor, ECF subfamily [Allomuricauda flava]
MKRTGYVFDGLMVLEYQSGNKKSLALLVKRHHKRLCHHAYRYTLDVDASQDIVQDSWGVIIKKLGTLRDPDSFSSWATRIVTRRALDYLNKAKRDKKHLETYEREFNFQDTLEGKNLRLQRLLEAIKELPENQQTVLRLFYTQEYSLKEIANIMEISVGTTKSRLFHAREKLKKIILNQKQ